MINAVPVSVQQHLLSQIPSEAPEHWKWHWEMLLRDQAMPELIKALKDAGSLEPYVSQCEDDPQEICVRVDGTTADGVLWRGMNVILLQPWYDPEADASDALAHAIVDHWPQLKVLGA